MSLQGQQPGAEGSHCDSVHFPPTSTFLEYQGNHHMHMDGNYHTAMAMAPPLSSASRAAAPVPPAFHELARRGGGSPLYGCCDRPESEYPLRRHSCGDHGFHSGNLIEQLLLQENQNALRRMSLSGGLSYGSRSRFRDSEERSLEEPRCCTPNLEASVAGCPDGWFRSPNLRQSSGERMERGLSFSEDELGHSHSLGQGRRISYPVCQPTVSYSQASHNVHEHRLHHVEASVPILGFSDADGRVRQRWRMPRQAYSEISFEDDDWLKPFRYRVGLASGREQDHRSMPGISAGSLPRTVVGSTPRPAGDSCRPPRSTLTSSQSLRAIPENSSEPSYQDNALQHTTVQRLVTQGPISLTNWYIMKVQIDEVSRVVDAKVALGGWLANREHVKTFPIVNRLDIHKVVTEDGVEVFLDGTMDQETSTANGFAPGIVQCLSAGFPYMWKQLLRVRPGGDSSSLAVSESLGGIHPIASTCLSENESAGTLDPGISKTVPEDNPCSSRDCEGALKEGSMAIPTAVNIASHAVETEAAVSAGQEESHPVETKEAIAARANSSDVFWTEAADAASVGTSVAVETVVTVTERDKTLDAAEIDASVPARADTSRVVRTDATLSVKFESSDAVDECQNELLQQLGDVSPTSLDPAPATKLPLEHVTDDFLSKEAESGSIRDTTILSVRRSCKSKKDPAQPVRSSRRLQKRQSRLSECSPDVIDSLPPGRIDEHVVRGTSADEEPAELSLDQQATTRRADLRKTNSIIEMVLQELQLASTEVGCQGSMDTPADPQPMEIESVAQTRDRSEYLSKDSDGLASSKSGRKETIEVELAGVEIDAVVSVEAFPDLESEEIGGTPSVAPLNLENEQIGPLDLERDEIEESAPVTPPELMHSNVRFLGDSLSIPGSLQEPVVRETSARVTRSSKRRLKLSPSETYVRPVTRSLKRKLSDPASIPDSSLRHEGANVEAVSNRDARLQEEVDAFQVTIRSPPSAKARTCSNCKQPCSPHDLLTYNWNVASSEVARELVLKEERVDYAPLSPSHHGGSAHDCRTESCPVIRRSGRFEFMKPATRFAKTGTSRRLIVGESVTGLRRGKESTEDNEPRRNQVSRKGRRSRKGSRKGSRKDQGFRVGAESSRVKRCSEGERSWEVKRPREITGSRECKEFSVAEGSSERFGPEPNREKSRRNSILPPPLPPPRVQDKSEVPEAFGLKMSRSGRLLVPPLAFWRSQSIEYDKDGGIIAIFDGFQAKPADTGCFNFTPPQEKHARRIQEKLCKAATKVTKRK